MANRHSHKKLRELARRRMAETGESYQKALHAVATPPTGVSAARGRQAARDGMPVDLIAAHYFGLPVTLATFEAALPLGRPLILRVPSSRLPWSGPLPLPLAMVRPAGVQ
jgi:hypothetical protein